MARRDLSEQQLDALSDWALNQAKGGSVDMERARQIVAAVAELKRLRQNEANTRFLMELEGEY